MSDNNDESYTMLEPNKEEYDYKYYVIPKSPKRKKQCGGVCCLLALFTFLLCFFLIPRKPYVYLENIYLNTNGSGYGKFQLKNNNFYDIEWSNPDVILYWLPYNGQTVGQVCYGNDDPCESGKYFKGTCAIKLGEFKSDNKFKTKSRSSKVENIKMIKSSQKEIACASWMLLNPYNGMLQRLLTKGHIDAKSSINNFGEVKVSYGYYYI